MSDLHIDKLVAQVMEELRVTGTTVNVTFDETSEMAGSSREKRARAPLNIVLSTPRAIRREMPELSEAEVKAKQVSQVAEELCHYAMHSDCHGRKVKTCTIATMRKHLTKKEMATPFVVDKIEGLKMPNRHRDRRCG